MRNERQEKHARAERLNAQIKELTSNEGTSGDRRTAPRVGTVSPRDFIHRRMAELDKDPKKDGAS
jgi:hypothetical protein